MMVILDVLVMLSDDDDDDDDDDKIALWMAHIKLHVMDMNGDKTGTLCK